MRKNVIRILVTSLLLAGCGGKSGGGGGGGGTNHSLSVQRAGTGSGTVTGGGINCGATCTASIAHGTAVTLSAAADAGSTFASWSGCDSATGTTCSLTINADRAVTANFTATVQQQQHILTVQKSGNGSGTVSGGGISCGATCSASTAHGTAVALNAVADSGSSFAGWTGCDSAIGAACNVTVNGDRSVTANFTSQQQTTASLKVVNSSSNTVAQLYVSPASSGNWGANQLTGSIAPGAAFTLINIPAGSYDLKAIASNGITYWQTQSAVSLTAGGLFTWTLVDAPQGSLKIVNNHCFGITELYVSPSSSGSWGQNQLSSAIAAGGSLTLTAIPAGSYDVKAVASDTVNWTQYGISVTAGGLYTLTLNMPSNTGCLKVVNSSAYTVGYLYDPVYPNGCTYNTWGTDRLGSLTIPPGYTFTLSNVTAAYRDLYALNVGQTIYWGPACGASIANNSTYTWTLH
ncbi:MAG: hypothetical protein ABR567_01770 [Myxococcales bacterium]|nr:hypothetical protein [Myxococcales bacterium]